MTLPAPPSVARPSSRFARPAVVLPILGAIIVAVAILTPEPVVARAGDQRLTTLSSTAEGAKALYELAQRLGWSVERQVAPLDTPGDARTILAELAPPDPLSAIEAHTVLETVRHGGALLLVAQFGRDPLDDSLHVRLGNGGFYRDTTSIHPKDAACAGKESGAVSLWPDDRVRLYSLRSVARVPVTDTFATVAMSPPGPEVAAAAVGFAYGRGRVAVVTDPDLLRNDVLRVCHWQADVVAVRILEFLRAGGAQPRDRIAFDEYHQGGGTHPGTLRAMSLYLAGTRSGRMLAQLAVAGLVLLLAIGPRAIVPRDEERLERRSPLEHVDALARAYSQVGATRTATTSLLRGVRRRTDRRRVRTAGDGDPAFLDGLAARTPALADDVAAIRRALAGHASARDLEAAGIALRRVEASLTPSST